MILTNGARLGPYEIIAPIGAGGMGEVYRARDTKLNRDVALKVLPDAFAADADRLARFEREAQVLASLNHPNIAHLYGFEDAGATHALVMELVEGPTLANRIEAGPIALADALPIAKQIAEALEYAHEQGIIHRDLKPANVKVRDDGTVKVLDFGLAKALNPAAGTNGGAMNSPTMTARATQMGVLIGTAAYMSPEQARGKAVDRRADIWAFGVVLYEMLSGDRAFKGEDISDTLAAVLRQEIMLSALPAATPLRLKRLIERCLERDPKQRLRDIGEARIELARIEAGGADGMEAPAAASAAPTVAVPRWKRALPWALAGGLLLALVLVLTRGQRTPAAAIPLRLSSEIGVDSLANFGGGPAAVISPDGRQVVLTANGVAGSKRQLFLKRLDQLETTPVSGTEDAINPFFSPDGQSIGFFAEGKLKTIPVTGGAAKIVCPAANGRGGTWADDDTIYFQPSSVLGPLMRIPANGGSPGPVGALAAGELVQRWPQALPGGTAILYTGTGIASSYRAANLMIQPLPSGTPRQVLAGGYHGRYVKSGHIVFIREGALWAVPFDLAALKVAGLPAKVLEGVHSSESSGGAQFSVSDAGTLVYLPGQGVGSAIKRAMFWMDATGATTPLQTEETDWSWPTFSPDGERIALSISDGSQSDVYVVEWATAHRREKKTKFTFNGADDSFPVWTPKNFSGAQRIVFASDRGTKGVDNLWWQRVDRFGEPQRLTESLNAQRPQSFDPSGKYLAFSEVTPKDAHDLMILPIEGDDTTGWKPGTPTVFLSTPKVEAGPEFSPDGRWIAYLSNEFGEWQVYVRPFPARPGEPVLISEGGPAVWPAWSLKDELFFQKGNRLMVANWTAPGGSFHADKPREWSPAGFDLISSGRSYAMHPDGKRAAIARPNVTAGEKRDKIVFVFNTFYDELRRVAPATKK
jgi:serine/threonine-protein kinase